ncbi:MAG TPA: HAMP domain-containing histidine kinase [Candidatus Acutalibacter pullistercoris]|uniref:histidine kinase n=1 Tax=Candidatus Acutalibacter pullistercoris TaxID=2838418 RepID=A0A9D2C2B6_9FIRM|nr:HAMP domain-containing histidine kinase [Candidatus Acutalibacter pullistercoris]
MGWAAAAVLAAVVLALGVKVWLLRRGAKALRLDLSQKLREDTNTLLSLPCRDRELRRLAASLNEELRLLRKERLRYQQGDRELKEAVVNVSHDLRTPLTALSGYVELLKGEALSPAGQRYLSQIEDRAQAMQAMTEELFRYSLAAEETALTLEPVDLRAAVEEALLSFYGAFQQKGVVPQLSLPQGPVTRQLDKAALSRVLGNILTNALKYSPGELAVALSPAGGLTFSNPAPGLDPVSAGRLFHRFYTVESSAQSTGLGLSIARELTQRLGGTISARWESGRLQVELTFPE